MAQTAGVTTDTKALLQYETQKKSAAAAYLFWFFLGTLGAHRFYVGRKGTAIVQLLMAIFGWPMIFAGGLGLYILGALGLWLLIDLFLIGGWVRAHNQKILTQLGV